jgi:hypothetical protein
MERRIHLSTNLLLAVKAQVKSGKTFSPSIPGIAVKPVAVEQTKRANHRQPVLETVLVAEEA